MKLPNAQSAEIAPAKLKDYLLNPDHRRGGTKARVLLSFGYRPEQWQRLADDLCESHLSAEVHAAHQTEYGRRFDIIAPLTTPDGRSLMLRSVWQIDTGTDHPRLITIYPE
jgi:hypothetical protein